VDGTSVPDFSRGLPATAPAVVAALQEIIPSSYGIAKPIRLTGTRNTARHVQFRQELQALALIEKI
jgi:hypothetical protein